MQSDRSKFKEEFKRRVYKFALDIIGFVEQLPKGQVSNVVGEQLLRSATSIGAHVVEAQGAASRKDYANFFSHALKSANETSAGLCFLHHSDKSKNGAADKMLVE